MMREDFKHLISKEEALERLFGAWQPQPAAESIPLSEAAGRVLAEDQYAAYDLPVYRASTMDGIAVRSDDFSEGMPDTSCWTPGTDYMRADTGDDFDDAFDAVIAIEDVSIQENGSVILAEKLNVKAGSNVKPQGADVRKGKLLARKGTVLAALDLAAIGMGGIGTVTVIQKPKAAFIPTGNELVPVGTPLQRGQNFDTNSPMVMQLLREMGAEPLLYPIVRDDPKALRAVLEEALSKADMVLINAGTSKGHEDYCAELLAEKGDVLFHGVAAVPGRPMSMAIVDGKPVVNLSGPSFACFYSMDWAVRAMVCRHLGTEPPKRKKVQAVLAKGLQSPPFFSVMMSIHLESDSDGKLLATPLPLRGPNSVGIAAALTAEAVYVTKLGGEKHEAGEVIEIELL